MYWQPATRQDWYRLAVIAVALSMIGVGALSLATTTADAQTDLTLGQLQVADVNRTVDGDVSDVRVSADLDYSHEVPDATRRVVSLKVGTDADTLETVDYANHRDPAGTDSGTVTLSGSLIDATALSTEDVDPATASTQETALVVAATVEIQRENGPAVTETVTRNVTVTLHDGATLEVAVGGEGTVTVETSG